MEYDLSIKPLLMEYYRTGRYGIKPSIDSNLILYLYMMYYILINIMYHLLVIDQKLS